MDEYYINQAGSGIGGFAGTRYQKGDGFFGRLISGSILPIIKKVLPFLGKTALNSGIDVINDLSKGDSFKESAKRRMKEAGESIVNKSVEKVKQLTGSGMARRKKKSTKKKKAKGVTKRKPALKLKSRGRKRSLTSKPGRKKRASDFL